MPTVLTIFGVLAFGAGCLALDGPKILVLLTWVISAVLLSAGAITSAIINNQPNSKKVEQRLDAMITEIQAMRQEHPPDPDQKAFDEFRRKRTG